jgi:aquaporin Z
LRDNPSAAHFPKRKRANSCPSPPGHSPNSSVPSGWSSAAAVPRSSPPPTPSSASASEASGAHLNPAVTFGVYASGRFAGRDLLPYIVAQVLGGIAASGCLYIIASGKEGFSRAAGFASNGYGLHSPGGYSLLACFVAEFLLTAFFLLVILGSTDERAPKGFAPIAIGLCLTLIHLVSIPITNTSVNPARSTGPAIFQGTWALSQLWLFWVAPIAGAIVGGLISRVFFAAPQPPIREEMAK